MAESRNNRVIELDRRKTSPRQEALIGRLIAGRGKLLTPYKIWIHSPGVAEGMEALGTYLNTRSTLLKTELELVVLSTAVHWGSPFVINAHSRHAHVAGLPDVIVTAILEGEPFAPRDPRLAAVASLTSDCLLAAGSIEEAQFDHYANVIGRDGIAEVVVLIGYFTSVALAMRLHEVLPKDD